MAGGEPGSGLRAIRKLALVIRREPRVADIYPSGSLVPHPPPLTPSSTRGGAEELLERDHAVAVQIELLESLRRRHCPARGVATR
jgi:hypothetical protein